MGMDKEEIIRLAIEAAAEVWEEKNQTKQERIEAKLRDNTKKILREYKRLKIHVESAIDSTIKSRPSKLKIVLAEIFDKKGYIRVQSIMNSKERTEVIIAHVDRMISVYKNECAQEDKMNFKLLELFYIEKEKEKDILKKMHISRSTFYEKLNEGIDDMTLLLWGM